MRPNYMNLYDCACTANIPKPHEFDKNIVVDINKYEILAKGAKIRDGAEIMTVRSWKCVTLYPEWRVHDGLFRVLR